MININIDNMTAFYFTMAIVTLAFALVAVFGRTEEKSRKSRKTTTTS